MASITSPSLSTGFARVLGLFYLTLLLTSTTTARAPPAYDLHDSHRHQKQISLQQPAVLDDVCTANCDNMSLQCCPGNPGCCCCSDVCGDNSCMLLAFPTQPLPGKHRVSPTAYLKFRGQEGNAPCCGPRCSMDRCLDLVDILLQQAFNPLRTQITLASTNKTAVTSASRVGLLMNAFSGALDQLRSKHHYDHGDSMDNTVHSTKEEQSEPYKDDKDALDFNKASAGSPTESDTEFVIPAHQATQFFRTSSSSSSSADSSFEMPFDPQADDCCGKNCSDQGCFRYILNTLFQLQGPIRSTLLNFNRTTPAPTGSAVSSSSSSSLSSLSSSP